MSKLILSAIISCLIVFPAFAQNEIDVGTLAYSKYDTSQIFFVARYWLPEDKKFSEIKAAGRVLCIENELRATGIYSEVTAKLFETIKENSRSLSIRSEHPEDFESYVIGEITLEGFPEVSSNEFQAALDVRGLVSDVPFLKYRFDKIANKISGAVKEAYPRYLPRKNAERKLWISVRPSGDKQFELIVSPIFPEC